MQHWALRAKAERAVTLRYLQACLHLVFLRKLLSPRKQNRWGLAGVVA